MPIKKSRLDHYLQQLEKENRDYTKEDYQQIDQMIEKSTIYRLQLIFLLHKVASDHNISVTQEDLSQELTRQIALMSSGRNTIDFSGKDRDKLQEQLHNLALRPQDQAIPDHPCVFCRISTTIIIVNVPEPLTRSLSRLDLNLSPRTFVLNWDIRAEL